MCKKTITPEQKKTLLEFLEEHPELVKQKQTNQFTNADTARLWQEVTLKLNAIPGAQKSWKEWRKTWSDIKSRTKKKISESKKEANKTGGGPNTSEVVDEIDTKILDIIGGDVVIEGLDIPELGIPAEVVLGEWDHQYFQGPKRPKVVIEKVVEVEKELNNNENVEPQSTVNETPKGKPTWHQKKRVIPPMRTPKKSMNMSTNKAAFDLVGATERTNQIKENYYNKKLEQTQKIHEDNLKLRKEEIQLKEKEVALKQEELQLKKQELHFKREELRLCAPEFIT